MSSSLDIILQELAVPYSRYSIFALALTASIVVSSPSHATFSYGWKARIIERIEAGGPADAICSDTRKFLSGVKKIDSHLAAGNNSNRSKWHYGARYANMLRHERQVYSRYNKRNGNRHPTNGGCDNPIQHMINSHSPTFIN